MQKLHILGPHSKMAKEKAKGLPWHRESFMERTEERRIAMLYGRPILPHQQKKITHKPSMVTFATEPDYSSDKDLQELEIFEVNLSIYIYG